MLHPAKPPMTVFLAPPESWMLPCKVHGVGEFIEEGNQFITAEEQLAPVAAWGVANTGSLGNCNNDKRQLREWVEKQKAIYKQK